MHRLIGIGVLCVALSACSDQDPAEQTWAKPYDQTTCTEWKQSMSPAEKEAASYDLVSDYLRRTGSDESPSSEQVEGFSSEITAGCSAEDKSLAQVAKPLGFDR
jgi:hypothetical protein